MSTEIVPAADVLPDSPGGREVVYLMAEAEGAFLKIGKVDVHFQDVVAEESLQDEHANCGGYAEQLRYGLISRLKSMQTGNPRRLRVVNYFLGAALPEKEKNKREPNFDYLVTIEERLQFILDRGYSIKGESRRDLDDAIRKSRPKKEPSRQPDSWDSARPWRSLERALHERFSDKRVSGEWFDVSEREVIESIEEGV